MLTILEKLAHCEKKSREQRYFVAPRTLLEEIEQEKIEFQLTSDKIIVLDKIFRIERG